MTKTEKNYRITKQTGFYNEICSFLIAIQGIAISTEYLLRGEADYSGGDYLTLEAKFLNAELHLPIFGPIQAVIQAVEPNQININVVWDNDKVPKYSNLINVSTAI